MSKISLLLILLEIFTLTKGQILNQNSSFTWPTHTAIIEKYTDQISTLKSTNLGNSKLKVQFNTHINFNKFPIGQIMIANKESYDIRVDSSTPFFITYNVQIQLQLTNQNNFLSSILLIFQSPASKTKKQITIVHLRTWKDSNVTYTPDGQYFYFYSPGSSSYWLVPSDCKCSHWDPQNQSQQKIKTFNITKILEYFLDIQYLQPTDYLLKAMARIEFNSNGTIYIQSVEEIRNRSYTRPKQLKLEDFVIKNTIFHESLTSKSYSNLTLRGKRVNQTFSSFFFPVTKNQLNAYQHIAIGLLNNTWVTQNTQYNFPIDLSTNQYKISIKSIFSFRQQNNKFFQNQTQKAACWVIILQKDQKQFTIHPSMEIYICPWWNNNAITGQLVEQNYKATDNMSYWVYQDISSTPQAYWKTFSFIPKQNRLKASNVDLLQFVQKAKLYAEEIKSYFIVGLQAGFRFYGGKGSFQFQNIAFEIQKLQMFNMAVLKSAIHIFVSLPNIGILFKIGPFLALTDDLSYFVYHSIDNYDSGIEYITQLCWNLTSSKWTPPISRSGLQSTQKTWIGKQKQQKIPTRFKWKNQDTIFLNNCRGYLLYTVPISIFTFIILKVVYKKITQQKIKAFLQGFGSWAYLGFSLIGENCQYLSFRCFQQLRMMSVTRNIPYYFNIVLTLIVLLITLAFAATFSAFAWYLANKSFKHLTICRRKNKNIHFLVSKLFIIRMVSGFFHAFVDNQQTCIACLCICEFVFICILSSSFKFNKFKTILSITIIGRLLKLCFFLMILLEVTFVNERISFNEQLTAISLSLFMSICLINWFQIIMSITVSIFVKDPDDFDQVRVETFCISNKTKSTRKQLSTIKASLKKIQQIQIITQSKESFQMRSITKSLAIKKVHLHKFGKSKFSKQQKKSPS